MSGRARVLLLDDDENVRVALGAIFENEGYEVLEAATLSEARRLMASTTFDAAVLDRYLGNAHGTDLIAELRSAFPAIVIAIVSGDSATAATADINQTKSDPPSVLLTEFARRFPPR